MIVERNPKRLFIHSIPENVTNEDLAKYFDTFGEVIIAEKVMKAGIVQSYGFVQFLSKDKDLVEKVVTMDNHVIKGSKLGVQQYELDHGKKNNNKKNNIIEEHGKGRAMSVLKDPGKKCNHLMCQSFLMPGCMMSGK